jgi:protein adenylyltransferase
MNIPAGISFDNSYARLPQALYTRLPPTPVSQPGSIAVNRALAEYLGINADWLESDAGVAAVAGNTIPDGAEPLATVYAGHQFGSYNPQLGDGRAILLGEVIATDGKRFDLQLKGSGPTPYSRGGDGRSPLGPVLREYILSEAMHTLGVPTTRALAAVSTGDQVRRDQFLPGAILARVASSHIRVGTMQYFAARGDLDSLRVVAEHVAQRHYPQTLQTENPYRSLLQAIIEAQAVLVSRWQLLGFIHGVMNTDNMLLCAETVDYGPCAFMDEFDPATVFSSIDHGGRYAYRNQPGIAQWNLACLAQSMIPLLHEDKERGVEIAQAEIDEFPHYFTAAYRQGLNRKLGFADDAVVPEQLREELFSLMASDKLDFTLTFRHLTDLQRPAEHTGEGVEALFSPSQALQQWTQQWQTALQDSPASPEQRYQTMAGANPAFIPRNHLVQAAIESATRDADFGPFHTLLARLQQPTVFNNADALLAKPPQPEQRVTQTFCGT